ncbi:MAG: hypothetical protein CVU89_00985 [Firmicutes bacterium HGW-Firmicutes-14]|nr:MAG: hypothetical protein CVU89_00985 [Firmicutes bacterium HGW-Firmicutes-14]
MVRLKTISKTKFVLVLLIITTLLFSISANAYASEEIDNEVETISVSSEQQNSIVYHEDGTYETMTLVVTPSSEKEAKAGKKLKEKGGNEDQVQTSTTDNTSVSSTGYYNVTTTREVWGVYLVVRYKLITNVYYNASTKQFSVNWTDTEFKCYYPSVRDSWSSSTIRSNSTSSSPAKTMGEYNGHDEIWGLPVMSWTYKIYQEFYYGGSIKAWNVKA